MASQNIQLCAYPWDFIGDHAAGERAAETGANGVALASVYHSVRAGTPLHPRHRIVEAPTAAVYFSVRESVWRDRRLVPASAESWAGTDSFSKAATEITSAGLHVEPWVVLTHSSALGSANRDLCVTNAFGDVYPYALCPSSEDVVEYATTVTAECALQTGASSMMVEACGPLGSSHLGHHEKTQGADWSVIDDALLSICFCAACSAQMSERGLDVRKAKRTIATGIGTGASSVEEILGESTKVILSVRVQASTRLARNVASSARLSGVESLSFHAQPDPWATGPFVTIESIEACADSIILPDPVVDEFGAETAEKLNLIRNRSRGHRVGAYLNALPPASPDSIAQNWPTRKAALDDVYIYHFGLLSRPRLDAVTTAVKAIATR